MGKRFEKRPQLGDFFVLRRKSKKASFLDQIETIMDWSPVEKLLKTRLKRKANAIGNPAYPVLPMFKALLLQRWFNLSDSGLEEALYDRISFVRFTGFSIEDSVPDETTICRFRNGLIKLKLLDKLLDIINGRLEDLELLVREGTIVDASVVESQRRPRKVIDVMPEDRAEDSTEPESASQAKPDKVSVSYSDDEDAAWLKKGKRGYYGYKVHVATDSRDGFFLGGHATAANKSDAGEFKEFVGSVDLAEGAYVFADKAYSSFENREFLATKTLGDGTMDKKPRGGSLTEYEKLRNKAISMARYIVERSLGTMKNCYDFARARYLGIEKVEAELKLIGMAFNLKKAVRLLAAQMG